MIGYESEIIRERGSATAVTAIGLEKDVPVALKTANTHATSDHRIRAVKTARQHHKNIIEEKKWEN